MEVFFQNLERGLLFISIILIIGFAIYIVFTAVTQASEQVKTTTTNLSLDGKLPSAGLALIPLPAVQEVPLILAAHEEAYRNAG